MDKGPGDPRSEGAGGSARALRTAVFAALLAPMTNLPAALARSGGSVGWLAAVAAVPLATAGLWLCRRTGPAGLAAGLTETWGKPGTVVRGLYYIWALALAALTAGVCVDRLGRTDYGSASPWLLSLAVTAVVWYLAGQGLRAFLRAARIFFLALTAAMALLGILGIVRVDLASLPPGPGDGVPGVLAGLLPVLGTMSVGGLAAVFPRGAPEGKEGLLAPAAWCLTAAGVCLLVTGILGAPLTAELPLPIFLALQGLGIPGGLRRVEAMGTAVWALSDLTLLGMAALAGETLAGGRRRGAWPVLLACFLGGALLPAERIAPLAVPLWGCGIGFAAGGPLLLLLTNKFLGRKKGGQAHLVADFSDPPQDIDKGKKP